MRLAESDTDSMPDRLINPGEYEPVLVHGYNKMIKVTRCMLVSLQQKASCMVGTKRVERLRRMEKDGLVLTDKSS